MNKEVILRLTKYRRLLYKLKNLGLEKVFSNNLSDPIGISSALVRKDFSLLDITGQKRGGYEIEDLIEKLDSILGRDKTKNVIIIGCGRIGSALLEYEGFKTENIKILAAFDRDPKIINSNANIPILNTSEIKSFAESNDIEVAIIAVPDIEAKEIFEELKKSGIRGFLNFAPIELRCSSECTGVDCPVKCVIHNVNIGLELEHIFYQLKFREEPHDE
ncbi:MAG: redox-sensing transcriptional repressor Rex [Spirochaetales bacterium]|nr:redox-sensing transcriptional repressor Rex [Spirochaetales bacterium]